jgi:hypothetical protein
METKNSKAKLALYSAMGIGASTFGATAANADICYTDLTGNELVFSSTSPVGIDMDADGVDDFSMSLGTFGPNGYSTSSWLLLLGAPLGAPATNGVAAYGLGGLQNLAADASISSRSFANSGYLQQAYTSFNPGNTYGAWPAGTTGFAGVRFEDGTGTTRFGWVEMTVAGDVANGDFADVQVTISGFAFAKDEAIVAGQTTSAVPEPSSLGLLALGGLGLAARRRRKDKIA